MALLIDRTVEVFPGVNIDQVYLRLEYSMDKFGNGLECGISSYPSREIYLTEKGGSPISELHIEQIPSFLQFSYDSSTDGVDVLLSLHEKIKTVLSTDVIGRIILKDPSTGNPLYDPSTGDILTEQGIITPKFAMDSSISFVDLD